MTSWAPLSRDSCAASNRSHLSSRATLSPGEGEPRDLASPEEFLDFQLNDEQLQLKKSVREFAEREIKPHIMEWDEAGEFPLATIKELGKLGLLGTIFPTEYGGPGMGYIEYVTTIEELSRVDGSVGIIVAAHTSLCSNHIFLAGTEEQKKKYVSKLATGEHLGAWGLTEPSSGSDAGSARMTAVRK